MCFVENYYYYDYLLIIQVVPNQYDIIPSWNTLIVDATFHLMKANENGAVKSKMTKMHHESFTKNDHVTCLLCIKVIPSHKITCVKIRPKFKLFTENHPPP